LRGKEIFIGLGKLIDRDLRIKCAQSDEEVNGLIRLIGL